MANPLITKINQATLNSWNDALNLLEITNLSPSIDEINKAFKKLALKVHPDRNKRNKDEEEAANEACKKIILAKEFLLKNNKNAHFAQTSFDSANFSSDILGGMFSEDSAYMIGPIVREARNTLLSWAEILQDVGEGTKPKEVRKKLKNLSLGSDDAASIDKKTLLQYTKLLFPDGKAPSYQIAKQFKDKEALLQYTKPLFPDGNALSYQIPEQFKAKEALLQYTKPLFPDGNALSYQIPEQFEAKDWRDSILFLQGLVTRYPKLRLSYQNFFKDKITDYLQQTKKSLIAIIQKADLNQEFENSSFIKFAGFEEFAYAFIGIEKPSMSALANHNPALLDAFSCLDECVNKNPQLFSDLVNAANLLRQNIEPNKSFLYSDTALRPHDLKGAKEIDSLCKGLTQTNVLNAQLAHVIRMILGKQFNNDLPEVWRGRFPAYPTWLTMNTIPPP